MYEKAVFRIAGDRGLLVEYGDRIDPEVNLKVRSMAIVLERNRLPGLIEVIPTYRSLLIFYDPFETDPTRLKEELLRLEERLSEIRIPPPRTVEIPVCYGGEFGPDISFVAEHNRLTVEAVIALHAGRAYPIYMIGFSPGFPFLGGLPEALHTPRLGTPRLSVPEGSVAIANAQTGIYPFRSPGGWRLIGRTPCRLFAPERPDPFLYKAGDLIRFHAISADEYRRISEERKR